MLLVKAPANQSNISSNMPFLWCWMKCWTGLHHLEIFYVGLVWCHFSSNIKKISRIRTFKRSIENGMFIWWRSKSENGSVFLFWYIVKTFQKFNECSSVNPEIMSSSEDSPVKGKAFEIILSIHSEHFSWTKSSTFNSLIILLKYPFSFLLRIHSLVFPRLGFSSSESINSFNTTSQFLRHFENEWTDHTIRVFW